MKREVYDYLIERYLKGTISQKEKDLLLDEALKCLNSIATLSRAVTRTAKGE